MSSFGLQLVFQSVFPSINKKQDVLVLFLHWRLISNKFLCLGVGTNSTEDGTGSEVLPPEWNNDPETYQLRYIKEKKIYFVKGINLENQLILSVLRVTDEQIASVTLDVNVHVRDDFKDFHQAYLNQATLETLIDQELINPFNPKAKKAPASKESTIFVEPTHSVPPPDYRPEPDLGPFGVGGYPSTSPGYGERPEINPFGVGRGDLDPLGGLGGGMLMDPRHPPLRQPQPGIPSNLPRGAVPPGARFDPFGPVPPEQIPPPPTRPPGFPGVPPNRGGFGGPDPDHLPPPGFPDMFM